jgi:hypothetical protein
LFLAVAKNTFLQQIIVVVWIKKINNAMKLSKHVNAFEVAILRVLIKRQQPIKLSALVSGFPDDSEDNVFSAISSLKLHGYIMLDDYQPQGYISINRERRKEILQILDFQIHLHKQEAVEPWLHLKENSSDVFGEKDKTFSQATTTYSLSQRIKTIAISSLIIIGLVVALASSMPTTSPETEFVAYHPYVLHKKWSDAYGSNVHDSNENPASLYAHRPASFIALKNCDQKSLPQQQT